MENTEGKRIRNVTNSSAMERVNKTHKGQFNDQPSLTVQGLSEPMSTIIERFQRGQTVMGNQPYYDSDVNENFENEQPFKASEYDLTDLDKARSNVERINREISDEKRRKAKEKEQIDQERIADEVLARRAKKEVVKNDEGEQLLEQKTTFEKGNSI